MKTHLFYHDLLDIFSIIFTLHEDRVGGNLKFRKQAYTVVLLAL